VPAARGRTVRRRNAGGRGRERGDPRARLARARAAAEAGDRAALGEVYQEGLRQGVVPRPALDALVLFNDPVALEVVGEVEVPTVEGQRLARLGMTSAREPIQLRTEEPTLGAAAYEAAWRWGPPTAPTARSHAFAAAVARAAFEAVVVDVPSISEAVTAAEDWWADGDYELAPPAERHAAVVRALVELRGRMIYRAIAGPPVDGIPAEADRVHELLGDLAIAYVHGWWSAVGPVTAGLDVRRRLGYGASAIEGAAAATTIHLLPAPNAFDPGVLAVQLRETVDHAWSARNILGPGMVGRAAVEAHLRANLRPWVLDGCPAPWPAPRAVAELGDP
jgi:hypothetical protein